MERLTTLASQRAVVIFSNNSCCMSHTIKALFRELGVNPAIYELDEDPRGREIERALQSLGCTPAIPAVFIGGRLMTSSTNSSSTKEIMQLHLEGSLVPLLRSVGAIWL